MGVEVREYVLNQEESIQSDAIELSGAKDRGRIVVEAVGSSQSVHASEAIRLSSVQHAGLGRKLK